MNLRELQTPFKEALACHQGLRRLGFSADDIYVMYSEGWLYIMLKTQGKEFSIDLGKVNCNEIEFPKIWAEIVEIFNTGPEELAILIWENSVMKNNVPLISDLIRKKGIMLPKMMN